MQVSFDDYRWAAGVATELVNTAPGVWSGIDQLPDARALAAFLRAHELVHAGVGDDDMPPVHALRERLRDLIDRPDRERLVAGASALTGATGGVSVLVAPGERARWAALARESSTVDERLALVTGIGVLGVVATLGTERFRPCSAATCSGVFIDTSRPGRRRYCMPELCGNRVNVANHRARRSAK